MAPRKPTADQKAGKAKVTTKMSEDKVVKRPARGYHKFRNGMLNVRPKGHEKELVKSNQSSPLLSLPAEIRDPIWEYVLGGKCFSSKYVSTIPGTKYKYVDSAGEPQHAMALLRTCRQIYHEAALMPLSLNLFSFHSYLPMKPLLHMFKKSQRQHITQVEIRIDTPSEASFEAHWCATQFRPSFLQFLPGLKHFRILCEIPVFEYPLVSPARSKDIILKHFDPILRDRPIKIEVEEVEMLRRKYCYD